MQKNLQHSKISETFTKLYRKTSKMILFQEREMHLKSNVYSFLYKSFLLETSRWKKIAVNMTRDELQEVFKR